jgi:hypothetical protein
VIKKGDCVHMPTPSNPVPHLWIVVTDVEPGTGKCVIVNITTLGHICDKTVVLHAGDHPSIEHDSIVRYQDALITTENAIEAAIRGRAAFRKQPCSPEVLKRVIEGIGNSKETSLAVKAFCGYPVKTKISLPPRK